VRIPESSGYPFEIKSLMEITSNSRGGPGYYYFFNIKVEDEGTLCLSDYAVSNIAIDNTAIKEDEDIKFQLFPNPASKYLYVESENETSITLINSLGKSVLTRNIVKGRNEINLSGINSGIYLSITNMNNRIIQKKIIISN
jgi:hypothetical protein